MNAPIFFMSMISPLQKIIIIKILVPNRPSTIILTVRNPSAMILHQEIVLEHESCYVTLKIDFGTSGSLEVTFGHSGISSWSFLVTCGHFRSPKRGFLMNQNMTQKDSCTVDPLTQWMKD